MEYFQGLWKNQPNTVIGLGVAILVLLGIYIALINTYKYEIKYLFKIFEDTSAPSSAPFSFEIANKYPRTTAITDRGDRIRTCDLVLPKH